ncbi:MAG: hypothetical protein HYS07_08510 [Chlamydiae bacterium]|nr:hypothetical protein [Chlamydiota bacterium]MBI3276415.1 hypothetical protein [Chlamydiota bacterium]
MKWNFKSLLSLFIFLLTLPLIAQANDPTTYDTTSGSYSVGLARRAKSRWWDEVLEPIFDGRIWKMAHEDHDESQSIREYILEGETIDHWTEIVTVHQFKDLQNKTSLKALMEKMQRDLFHSCPSTQWEILNETLEDLIYTWQLKDCPAQEDQYELARLIIGKEAIYLIRYTHKASKIDLERYTIWLDLLADVKLSTYNDLSPIDFAEQFSLKSTNAKSQNDQDGMNRT